MPSFEKFEDLQDLHLVQTNDSALSSSRTAAEKLVGTIIEQRYQLLSLIGEGGMGFVFKAKQLTTGRMVAIKMIASENVSSEQIMRFCQEAKAACAFSHPNAVAIYELFVSDGTTPYLAMQYVEGLTLSEELERNGPLAEDEAARIFSQVADALAHAHQSHVLHRDIKPSNIMLVNDIRGNRSAMLLDFGIAKLSSPDGKSLDLTKTGEVMGTPYYMSPEQCQGKEADQRSDIYALGCVMYEALTGKKPVAGDNFLQVLTNQVQEKIKPISEHATAKDVSPRMKQIIHKAIEKDPNKRFQSMTELWQVLSGKADLPVSKNAVTANDRHQPRVLLRVMFVAVTAACAFGLNAYFLSQKHTAPNQVTPQAVTAQRSAPAPNTVANDWASKYVDAVRQFRLGKQNEAIPVFKETINKIKSIQSQEPSANGPSNTDAICRRLVEILYQDPASNEFWSLGLAFQHARIGTNKIGNVAMANATVLVDTEGLRRYPDEVNLRHDLGPAYEYLAGDEYNIGDKDNLIQALNHYRQAAQVEDSFIKSEVQHNRNPVDIYNRIANSYHSMGEIENHLADPTAAKLDFSTAELWFAQADERIKAADPGWAYNGIFLKEHGGNQEALGHTDLAAKLIQQAHDYQKSHSERHRDNK